MRGRYERPQTVAEAVQLLASDSWALLAGGTDWYPARVGKPTDEALLDLSALAALRGIEGDGTAWTIGATTTWSDLARAELPPLFHGLQAAARDIGGVQIQNAGTVGGNLCNASPAADGVPALLALDASVVLVSAAAGERCLPLRDFIVGPRRTLRRSDELLTALRIPARAESARSVFAKLGGRRYLVISIAMVSAVVVVDADGIVSHAAVAVGSCSPVAQRLDALEARLVGVSVAAMADLVEAGDLAALTPIDDVRASATYRRD
ncbi:MAG: FAD binding domain-containing protein, partial [Pseudomonadota bacterium]|nr:FAD binding domain-containing protein [Pseudomonadota bacterium]